MQAASVSRRLASDMMEAHQRGGLAVPGMAATRQASLNPKLQGWATHLKSTMLTHGLFALSYTHLSANQLSSHHCPKETFSQEVMLKNQQTLTFPSEMQLMPLVAVDTGLMARNQPADLHGQHGVEVDGLHRCGACQLLADKLHIGLK